MSKSWTSTLREELRRPATAIAVVLALLGALLSWYFYEKSEKAGFIAVVVDQVQVFDKTRIHEAPLRVTDAHGEPITNNVFAANITVWNAGNAQIKQDDVRQPFRVVVGSGLPTIDISATSYTNNNVDGFSVDSRTGILSWKYFDPNEGLRIRVIYAGDTMQDIQLEGFAAGVGKPRVTRPSVFEQGAWAVFNVIVNSIVFLCVSLFSALGAIGLLVKWWKTRQRKAALFGLFWGGVALLLWWLLIAGIFIPLWSTPPL